MIAIIPNLMAKIFKSQMFPTDVDIYQELEKDPEAVQRWKEWEEELGKQGAEAEGVTETKIQRRLSIAASIVSRNSSRYAPSLSSRRGRSKSQHTREGTIRSDRASSRGRPSHEVERETYGEGRDRVVDLFGEGIHRRGTSEQPRRSLSGHQHASINIVPGPRSATQPNFPRTGPFTASTESNAAVSRGLRRASSSGNALEHPV